MSLAFKRFKVYLRVGLVMAILVLGAVVLFMNRKNTVPVWFFGLIDPGKPTNVVWVMLWTAALTRTAFWIFSFSRGMIRDMREIRNQRAAEIAELAQRERTAKLDAREKRIDDKLKQFGETKETEGEETQTPDDD